jgi:hypothetical protein
MSKPCIGCDKNEATIYRKGKIRLRFKRAGRKVGLNNYEDGKLYWMKPRHAAYPWFEPVDNVELPIVEPATQEESVYERIIDENTLSEAIIGESGYTLSGSGLIEGMFRDPEEPVDEPAEIVMPEPPTPKEEEHLGFPENESPSRKWKRAELLAYITHRGAADKLPSGYKSKAVLLDFASRLT